MKAETLAKLAALLGEAQPEMTPEEAAIKRSSIFERQRDLAEAQRSPEVAFQAIERLAGLVEQGALSKGLSLWLAERLQALTSEAAYSFMFGEYKPGRGRRRELDGKKLNAWNAYVYVQGQGGDLELARRAAYEVRFGEGVEAACESGTWQFDVDSARTLEGEYENYGRQRWKTLLAELRALDKLAGRRRRGPD